MAQAQTPYAHVVLDETGVARIDGTRYKVVHLVAERLAYGWSAEQLGVEHPDLTLGQIYSALAYYADHTQALQVVIRADAALSTARKQ